MNQIATLHTTLKATDDEYQNAKNLSESMASREVELKSSIQILSERIEKQAIDVANLKEENLNIVDTYWNMVAVGKKYENELASLQSRCKSLTQYLGDRTYSFISDSEATKTKMQAKFDEASNQSLWSKQTQSNEIQSIAERKALRDEESLQLQIIANEQANLERTLKGEEEDLAILTAVLNHENQNANKAYQTFHHTPAPFTSNLSHSGSEENEFHKTNNEEFCKIHNYNNYSNVCYDYHTITTTTITEEEVIDLSTNQNNFTDNSNNEFYVNESESESIPTPWFQRRKRKSQSFGGFRTGAEILYSTSHP